MVVRVDPDIYERVTSRPEGSRSYVTRLVRDDIEREASTALVVTDGPADVLGQLLIPDESTESAPATKQKTKPL